MGFTEFFNWALSGRISQLYSSLRWPGWENEVVTLPGDHCFGFYPFLWTKEGSTASSSRRDLPVQETFDFKSDVFRRLEEVKPFACLDRADAPDEL